MKLVLLLTLCAVATGLPHSSFSVSVDEHWEQFKTVFNKSYFGHEETMRRQIWEQRLLDIVNHNIKADLGFHSFKRGLNKYSDLSYGEYMRTLNGFKVDEKFQRNDTKWLSLASAKIPEEIDWRNDGLVTPIKDQQDCGACWAFSSTGSLEGQIKKKTGKLVSLSEQNLIDCVTDGCNGCGGGFMDPAFEYVKKNKGIDLEDSYPYVNQAGPCRFDKSKVGGTCAGYVDIPVGDEEALKQAVATVGPISVGINAQHEAFHTYKSGIYDEPNCPNSLYDLTHAVLVVGYGVENGVDYWLVKNSWGMSYGIKGYIKMSRNKNNQCGIATKASYPLV